jgi:hypothetical protein
MENELMEKRAILGISIRFYFLPLQYNTKGWHPPTIPFIKPDILRYNFGTVTASF